MRWARSALRPFKPRLKLRWWTQTHVTQTRRGAWTETPIKWPRVMRRALVVAAIRILAPTSISGNPGQRARCCCSTFLHLYPVHVVQDSAHPPRGTVAVPASCSRATHSSPRLLLRLLLVLWSSLFSVSPTPYAWSISSLTSRRCAFDPWPLLFLSLVPQWLRL